MIYVRHPHHSQSNDDKSEIFARDRVKDLPHSTVNGILISHSNILGIIKLQI